MTMRMILYGLCGLAIVYIAACGFLYAFQRSLIYFPSPAGAAPGEPVLTRSIDGADALIYLGGNAEDVSGSLPEFAAAFPGHSLYLLRYRGYGGRAGQPSEAALFADSLALFDQVYAQHKRVLLIGRSLGSGLAVRVASQRPVTRLMLVTPYDSLQGVAAEMFPLFPVRWLLIDKYESWRYAPSVTAPTVILAVERDEVIPKASTELLRTRFRNEVVSYRVVPGAGHNDIGAFDIRRAFGE